MTDVGTGRTALIVDDDQVLLDLLDNILQEVGFTTTTCQEGTSALHMLAKKGFDLLVVDVGLPDMNGLYICEVVRKQYGNNITVFIITGDNQRSRCVTALELGADDFVGKPFDTDELLVRIDAKLRRTRDNPH